MMAKPKHGRWNNYAGLISTSSPDAHRPTPYPNPHSHKHTRARSRAVSRSSHRFPSPAVLSALAVIATTPPVVAGGPLPTPPPTFLCPFIERDNIDPSSDILVALAPRAAIPSTSAPSPTPTPTSHYTKRQVVADRYVRGSDSLWRKTDAWTLFGSTCCSSSTASTSSLQPQPSSSQTPMPTSTPTTAQFDTSVLPAGWDNTTNLSSTTESTIILALAIVLAGSICVFIIGCLIWRRRKKRTRDIERKLGHRLGADDDSQDNGQEKDVRGKMRVWAKASARWKSNIRQSARRRRKRPMVSSIVNRPSSPDSPQLSIVAPSRRGSFVSEEPDPSRPEAVLCLNGNATEPLAVLHDRPRSASPPTYGASFVPRFSNLPPSSAVSNPSSTPSPDSPHAVQHSNQPSFIEDELLPYVPRSDGHVATDDKTQLAHIRELASSPPIMVDAANASTMQSVSAPEWHEVEDDLERLGIDLSQVPMSFHDFDLPPSFPPPPSKADIPFGYLDNHPLRYGEGNDILVSLPVPGPSASPSAPPIDDPGLEPSAPSLEGEDDLFQDWDGASTYVPEAPTSADLDSTSACAIESSISSAVSSTSRAFFHSIQESAARDGILPRYHP